MCHTAEREAADVARDGGDAGIIERGVAAAEKELEAARAAKPAEPLFVAATEARLKAVRAVIAADRVAYRLESGDAAALAKAAAKAQALHNLCRARWQLHTAEQILAAAKAKADKAALQKAEQAVTVAKNQVAATEKVHAAPPATYVGLSPTYPATSTGRRKALACQACHGLDGLSKLPDAPHLAGQPERYLVKSLDEYRKGVRKNELILFSQPRPIRILHRSDGWTTETIDQQFKEALKTSFVPLERSQNVFPWDPV